MAKTPDKEASVEEAPVETSTEEQPDPFTEQRQQDPLPEADDVGEERFPGDPNTYPDQDNPPRSY